MGHEIYVSLFPLFLIFLGVELFRITLNIVAIHYPGHAASQTWLMVG